MENYYIGLDIGGTKCAATLAKIQNNIPEILDKDYFLTAGQDPYVILEKFSSFIGQKLKDNYIIAGIGISCGGPLDSRRGVIMSPPSLPLWDNIEIVKYFEDKFNIKTYLQNDANACAVAEWKFGAGRGSENMIFLTFGTGFGAGIIMNGRLCSGANDNAGEIGHVRLTKTGPLGYYKKGSCEGYCSGSGMPRLALIMGKEKKYQEGFRAFLEKVGEDNISAKTLSEEARKNDAFAMAVYKNTGEMFGKTLSILIDILNPEKIVVGGVFMRSGDLILPHAIKVMKKECLSYSLDVVEVLPAGLGENIGDYAAVSIAQGGF